MTFKYCTNCEKKTGHKRAFGAGTVIGFFFTFGLWLLTMPFYPIRCSICGMDIDEQETRPPLRLFDHRIIFPIIPVVIMTFVLAEYFVVAALIAAVLLFRFLHEKRDDQGSRRKKIQPSGKRGNPIKLRDLDSGKHRRGPQNWD